MKTHSRFGVTIAEIPDATPVTYAELATLISGSDLVVGRKYLITDYRTVHTIPNTVDTNTGTLEPLIVTALAVNDLEPVAYSTTHKDDIVYYDHVNNSKVNGSTKGCIYRRIDTVNNSDIPFDWREVKFRRWQINVDTVFDIGDTYANGDVVLDANHTTIWISLIDGNIGNTPVDTDGYWRKFEWDNLAYVSYSPVSMVLGSGLTEFTIPVTANYQDIKSITSAKDVKMYYERVTLLDILESNNSCFSTIHESIIKVSGDMRNNHINGIYSSDIDATNIFNNSVLFFNRNSIKGQFNDNSIYRFEDNFILKAFRYNSIRTYTHNRNTGAIFDTNRQGSAYGGAVSENVFDATFNNNHLDKIAGATFRYNEFHKIATVTGYSFLAATHVFGDYTKEIIERPNGTPILRYTDNTNTILYVAVDA